MDLPTVMVLVVTLGRAFSFFGKVQKQYQKLAQGESAYWAMMASIDAADAARETATNKAYLDFLATLPQQEQDEIHRTSLEMLKADGGGFAWHRYEAGLKLKQKIEEMPAVYPVYLRQVCSTVRARYPDEGLPDLPAAEAM